MNRIQEIEARLAAIRTELEAPDANLEALQEEVRSLQAERDQLRAEAERREELRRSVANGAGSVTETGTPETTTRTDDEVRRSTEYVDAFARYMRTGDPRECRALLTTNVQTGGTVPVPVIVDDIIRTAWENDELLQRINRTNFRGNLRVSFELSATEAVVHVEGTEKPDEEELTLGIVELIPANVKKWIRMSDEAVTMGGEAFVSYVYRELAYRIVRKLSQLLVADAVAAPASSTATAIGIPVVTGAPSVTILPEAAAHLSDEAGNVCVVMNRLTEVAFIQAHAAGNFAIDPFAGMPRVYTSALKAYGDATTGETYAIVGDLHAMQVNYPEGEDVVIKYDDMTEAEYDMVKIVGRQYAAHGITEPGKLVKVAKA